MSGRTRRRHDSRSRVPTCAHSRCPRSDRATARRLASRLCLAFRFDRDVAHSVGVAGVDGAAVQGFGLGVLAPPAQHVREEETCTCCTDQQVAVNSCECRHPVWGPRRGVGSARGPLPGVATLHGVIAKSARRPPVIADVARVAGVSVPTVSRVLTGSVPVSPAKRALVMAAIDKLGYRPSAAARALAGGRVSMIAVLASNTTRYGYASTLRGIEEGARAAGYTVVITVVESEDPSIVDEAVTLVLGQPVAGVIVLEFDPAGVRASRALPDSLPVVGASNGRVVRRTRPHAYLDDRAAAMRAVEYLLGLGHHTVHHVAIPLSGGPNVGRASGWRDALIAAGAPVPELIGAGWDPASGYEVGAMLARDESVTAVLAGNDELAINW